jgi:hypothetical protein
MRSLQKKGLGKGQVLQTKFTLARGIINKLSERLFGWE